MFLVDLITKNIYFPAQY